MSYDVKDYVVNTFTPDDLKAIKPFGDNLMRALATPFDEYDRQRAELQHAMPFVAERPAKIDPVHAIDLAVSTGAIRNSGDRTIRNRAGKLFDKYSEPYLDPGTKYGVPVRVLPQPHNLTPDYVRGVIFHNWDLRNQYAALTNAQKSYVNNRWINNIPIRLNTPKLGIPSPYASAFEHDYLKLNYPITYNLSRIFSRPLYLAHGGVVGNSAVDEAKKWLIPTFATETIPFLNQWISRDAISNHDFRDMYKSVVDGGVPRHNGYQPLVPQPQSRLQNTLEEVSDFAAGIPSHWLLRGAASAVGGIVTKLANSRLFPILSAPLKYNELRNPVKFFKNYFNKKTLSVPINLIRRPKLWKNIITGKINPKLVDYINPALFIPGLISYIDSAKTLGGHFINNISNPKNTDMVVLDPNARQVSEFSKKNGRQPITNRTSYEETRDKDFVKYPPRN